MIDDYRRIPLSGEELQLIVQDGERSAVIVTREEGLRWVVVKATASGEGLLVTSVRRLHEGGAAALRRLPGARVLLDRMGEAD
jgi:hypothetical protein